MSPGQVAQLVGVLCAPRGFGFHAWSGTFGRQLINVSLSLSLSSLLLSLSRPLPLSKIN